MKARWQKHRLQFKIPAGTSRGVLKNKDSYFLLLEREGRIGVGECGLLRGLSFDDKPDYEEKLDQICDKFSRDHQIDLEQWADYPSIRAGAEMALLDLKSEKHILFPSDFTDGWERQPINGLIWMGSKDSMYEQIKARIEDGFLVLKMKIGAINIEDELELLKNIRQEFSAAELQLRVDANGAFSLEEAPDILKRLDDLRVHSIEQPIKAGQWSAMAKLCEESPLPIALDEELIGINNSAKAAELLDFIKPKFIILKPSFLGGFRVSEAWIEAAEARGIGWWVTSALESNVGLSAISQWNYTLHGHLASGLGTGSLYTNNFDCPLKVVRGTVAYDPKLDWDLSLLA